MKIKNFNKYLILIVFAVLIFGAVFWINFIPKSTNENLETLVVKTISRQILADGTVDSANTAILHFQTGGKLTYLPVKEGDRVYQDETIARLDTYALQKQVQLAANTYEIAQNNANQTQESQQAGVLEGQQRYSLDTTNKNSYSNVTEVQVISDNVKKIVDNANLAQNSAQLNVDLANYALSLSTLASPISGVVTHLDVANINTNVTSSTNFVVADPNNLVFDANIPESMINYISIGSSVQIKISNTNNQTTGTVTKIYPQSFTMPDGETGYKVEISALDLTKIAKMGQSGSVMINSNLTGESIVVPTWIILGNHYVWVMDNGQFVLKRIETGKVLGRETEILSGLKYSDKIILNPKAVVVDKNYKLL